MSKENIATIMIVIGGILAATGVFINKKRLTFPGAGKEYMKIRALLNISIGILSIILGVIFLLIDIKIIFVQVAMFGVLVLIVLLDLLLKKTVK